VPDLSVRTLFAAARFEVHDVRCCAARGGWSAPERSGGHTLVLPRHGVYRRRVDGREDVVDAMSGYLTRPGDVQQIAHPSSCGDQCTAVDLAPELVASVWGDSLDDLPALVIGTRELHRRHRRLLFAARCGDDATDVAEHVVALIAHVLAARSSRRVAAGRPSTAQRRARIVADARALIGEQPGLGLIELARTLAVSPHHLSRIFAAHTGMTLTDYRSQVRVQLALARLDDGEPSLSRLAADLGFSDHAHLTRTLRRHTGSTPSQHRRGSAGPPPHQPGTIDEPRAAIPRI
jgi:AraC-like DNA-binding protein